MQTDSHDDYEEDVDEEELAKEGLKRLTDLANTQVDVENQISELEEKIKIKQKFLVKINQDLLPTLMQDLKFTDFGLEDGSRVDLVEKFFGGFKKEDEAKAFTWFRETDNGDFIKNSIKATLDMGDDDLVEKIAWLMNLMNVNCEIKPNIHATTLKSFIRKELEAGRKNELPDYFNIQEYKETKITKPKKKKGNKNGKESN